jgi:hypothetical protein
LNSSREAEDNANSRGLWHIPPPGWSRGMPICGVEECNYSLYRNIYIDRYMYVY